VNRVSHVLDTSALLAHYFNEPGAELLDALWADESNRLAISVITVAELKGRLHHEIADDAEALSAANAYVNELTTCLPVDRATAEAAWQLRQATPSRIPLVDAIIAATARVIGAVLVHKDPHMSRISSALVSQVALPQAAKLQE
jgi:predicted nucleic acid-binding protein